MKNRKQFVKVLSERLDTETGELTQHIKTVSYNVKVDDRLFKLYTDNLKLLKPLTHTAIKLLFYLAKNMNYENMVAVASDDKMTCSKDFNVGIESINKALTSLVANDILFRIGRGKYMINPYLLTKGSAERAINLREQCKWKQKDE